MKRKTLKRWETAFSGNKAKADVENLPRSKQKGTSLVLVRKQPVTFRLSRLENPEDFQRMSFVIKACGKGRGISYKTVLHVERTKTGSRLVATDGYRLHVAEIPQRIKSGEYKPLAAKDEIVLGKPLEGINFPAWEKAVPKNTVESGVIDLGKTGKGNTVKKAAEMSLAVNALNVKTGLVVNFQYIAELPKTVWAVYKEPGLGKVVVKQQDGEDNAFAVFAPVGKAA
jgi:hypothetical protein